MLHSYALASQTRHHDLRRAAVRRSLRTLACDTLAPLALTRRTRTRQHDAQEARR